MYQTTSYMHHDARYLVFVFSFLYFVIRGSRMMHIYEDEVVSDIIVRHGGSVEEVRKNLSVSDMARARAFADYRIILDFIAPINAKIKPPGSDYPE